jgi:uncharacterized protein YjbJ (UPF0337 family)
MTNEKIDQLKGRAEQAAGDLTDDEDLKNQGERHEQGGKLKEGINKAGDKVNDAVDKVQEKLDKNDDDK